MPKGDLICLWFKAGLRKFVILPPLFNGTIPPFYLESEEIGRFWGHFPVAFDSIAPKLDTDNGNALAMVLKKWTILPFF